MRIVITGAAGAIGRSLVAELSAAHELRLLDRAPMGDPRCRAVDLGRPAGRRSWRAWPWSPARHAGWTAMFEGADVVLHLAAQPSSAAPWEEVVRDNVQATWNVADAALAHRVRRIVFASSTWAVKALERSLAPACYAPGGPKIGSDEPPRPLTPYGLSKAMGEQMGRALVDEGRLPTFLAVRIGHHLADPPAEEELRRLWVGTRDLCALLRRCAEADVEGFHVLYAISSQASNPYDLAHTRAVLDWRPAQHP